jgi:hypothetical protein
VASSANASAAQYTVTHAGGSSPVTVNQRQNGGQWHLLGTYSFAPDAGHKVKLAAAADGTVIADVVPLVGGGAPPSNLLYVHSDHLGTPQKLTDADQAIVWDGEFEPFGEEVAISGTAELPLRFPGRPVRRRRDRLLLQLLPRLRPDAGALSAERPDWA